MCVGEGVSKVLILVSESVSVLFGPDCPCSSVRVLDPTTALSPLRKEKVEHYVWNCRKEELMISCFVDYILIVQSLLPYFLPPPPATLIYFSPDQYHKRRNIKPDYYVLPYIMFPHEFLL
jgi:hypothetical protein